MVAEVNRPDGAEVHFEPASTRWHERRTRSSARQTSGSVFSIGDTTVGCTATSADMQQASCGFAVRVRVSQTLSRTKFMAFGDSITDGVASLVPLITLGRPESYPYKLEHMLAERYPAQTFVVFEQGRPGEKTTEGAIRLPEVIDSDQPEVVLLLEGVNAVRILSTGTQAAALRRMITTAQRRNVEVIIATLMPVSPEHEEDHRGTASKISALNERIFQLADEFGLGNVVDLFALFQSNMHLLGADGLHPTEEGQTRIAEAFRDEIVRRYESRATMTSRRSNLANDAR